MSKISKKKQQKQQKPKVLDENSLDKVSGGVELENVQITSYQLGVLDNDTTAGGGPHVKVFSGASSR